MRIKKKAKRVIAGALGFVMATSIFFTSSVSSVYEVQAKTNVFEGITSKYKASGTFTILEIVPGTGADDEFYKYYYKPNMIENNRGDDSQHNYTISKSAEMGYFFAKTPQESPQSGDQRRVDSATGVSRAGRYSSPLMATDDAMYPNALYQLYTFGMIKPDGMDSAGVTSKVGEYPIYARSAILSKYYNSETPNLFEKEKSLVKGVYSMNTSGNGKYDLINGYKIDDNGNICEVSISYNSPVSDNSVSGNAPEPEPYEILTPVTDIDKTKLQLPASTTKAYVTLNSSGTGNLDFARSEMATTKTEYYGVTDLALYYSTKNNIYYTNSDWFREYVFGDNVKYNKTKIDYVTKAASKVTAADIDAADLIYISGEDKLFDAKTGNDITDAVLVKLYNRVVHEHKAVMMDYLCYSDKLTTNISKLALLLSQNSQAALLTKAADSKNSAGDLCFDVDSKEMQNTAFLKDTAIVDFLKEGMDKVVHGDGAGTGETNGSYVRGNFYSYNHHMSDFTNSKSMVDALDNFANGDFATPYTATATAAGFSEVLNYISVANQKSLSGTVPNHVTPAIAIQYILVTDGSLLSFMKNSLRVLEIEPVPAYRFNFSRGSVAYADIDTYVVDEFKRERAKTNAGDATDARGKAVAKTIKDNRKAFVQNYLSDYYNEDIDSVENSMLRYIDFTSMTVSEFNGRSEDLVENYDIIYIGDEIKRNIDNSNLYVMENNITKFNDSNMNGNVYFGIGDEISVRAYRNNNERSNYLSGFIDDELYLKANYSSTLTYKARYQARDINKNKLVKLEEFLKSDGLIIVDEDILGYENNEQKVNPTKAGSDNGRVDNSSNLYELLMFGNGMRYDYSYTIEKNNKNQDELTGRKYKAGSGEEAVEYPNLVSAKKLRLNPEKRDEYSKYVSSDRLNLIMASVPTPYTYSYKTNTNVIDTASIKYMENIEDGMRCLKYEFAIGSELSTVENADDYYIATLYFDINKDGKYSKTTEKIDDCVITSAATNGVAPVKNENGEYLLNLNTNYVLKRKLSDEYCGVIKWKLEVRSVSRTTSHATSEGYTLVKNLNEDKQVNILQIGPKTANSTLNLQRQMYDNKQAWYPYLHNVPGYEVHIKRISIDQFEYDFKKNYEEYNNNLTDANKLSVEEYATKVYFKNFYLEKTVENPDTNANAIKYLKDADDTNSFTYSFDKDVQGVNMLVLGFGDYIQRFESQDAIKAISAFIEEGKPVLMAHDFIDFTPDTKQTATLRNAVGADKYGATQNIKVADANGTVASKVLDANNNEVIVPTAVDRSIPSTTTTSLLNRYTSSAAALYGTTGELHRNGILSAPDDALAINRVETTGKEVAYRPGTERRTIIREKQGYSNYSLDRWGVRNNLTNKYWIQANGAKMEFDSDNSQQNYYIEKLNDGQLTEYPYHLPEQCSVAVTHAQYYELDLTTDADNDGESDVVVWYTLGASKASTIDGRHLFNDYYGGSLDPAAGYYIYNDGNVTYTGAGHQSMSSTDVTEIQLFVNTLLAAFEVGNQSPVAGFYESVDTNAKPVSCIAVPYDGNVTKPKNTTDKDSSIIEENNHKLYTFVDPNVETGLEDYQKTKVYFKVSDPNLIRGDKDIYVKYYLKVEDNMNIMKRPNPLDNTKEEEYVNLYGRDIPITTIPGAGEKSSIRVVDISGYINTYEVNQTTGQFADAPMQRITQVIPTLPEESLTLAKDNAEDMLGAVKNVKSGLAYGLYLPMSYLNENASFTIYTETMTKITSVSTSGGKVVTKTEKAYKPLNVTKADLLKLN